MLRRGLPFLAGLLSGLLASSLLLILIAEPRGQPIALKPPPTPLPLRIHVAGAVQSPGVYDLPRGSIVADALAAAGGASPSAHLSGLNLAASLADGAKLFVPDIQTATEHAISQRTPGAEATDESLLSINDATVPELETLPGIGPSLASAIFDYREDHGPFTTASDLLAVPGIGPAKLAAIEDLIRVP